MDITSVCLLIWTLILIFAIVAFVGYKVGDGIATYKLNSVRIDQNFESINDNFGALDERIGNLETIICGQGREDDDDSDEDKKAVKEKEDKEKEETTTIVGFHAREDVKGVDYD